MPLTQFICPDGQKVNGEECLSKCRIGKRCAALATLSALWETERKWDGVPHITDLISGTMYNYLKITRDYAVSPDSRAFTLLGSAHHKLIEASAKFPAEVEVHYLGVQGRFDGIEPNDTGLTIIDNKTWGSYKVAKALGIYEAGKMPDPSGEKYQKSGKWGAAGSPKMITRWEMDPRRADLTDEKIQLNFYRLGMVEQGFPITELKIQATVRDGGSITAYQRGVSKNLYLIDVPLVEDNIMVAFITRKKQQLMDALDLDCVEICSPEERWDNRRCAEFCDVWSHCPQGIMVRRGNGNGK
jgi:hypothetical protein